MIRPTKIKIHAKTTYGIFVALAERTPLSEKNSKIKNPPTIGAIVVPSELKACERFKRLDAPSGGPNKDAYGFAVICNNVNPRPSTNKAPKNRLYCEYMAAG